MDGKAVMMGRALVARQPGDAVLALALAADTVARVHRRRTNQIALAVPATRCHVAVTILQHFNKKFNYLSLINIKFHSFANQFQISSYLLINIIVYLIM